MNRIAIRACSCFFLLLSVVNGNEVAAGQVNLVPEEGFFGVRAQIASYYYAAVSEKLLSSKPIVRRCQALFLPSFSPESAVYLLWDGEKTDDVPVVVSIEMERSLWSELHQLIEDAAPDKTAYAVDPEAQLKVLPKVQLKTKRSEAPIEVETAEILDRLWRQIISQARFPEKAEFGLDGENVHFGSPAKGGYRTAQVWSPDNGTPAYELIAIAKTLQKYPQLKEAERKSASKSLTIMAKRLLAKIEKKK